MKKNQYQAQILNIKLTSTSKKELLMEIKDKIAKKGKFVIFTPNPEIILASQSDSELASVLNSADVSIPDGVGLKLILPNLTIIKGRELMLDLLDLANRLKLRVYFLGAREHINMASVEKARTNYHNLEIKGTSGPYLDKNAIPISNKDKESEREVIKDINSFKPHFLFVAFGTPKEQKWIARHKEELKVNCIMEVGGSLDYFTGAAKLPPVFFTSLNLEWLWRLIHEPSRAPRIFNALILFPLKVLKEKLFAE